MTGIWGKVLGGAGGFLAAALLIAASAAWSPVLAAKAADLPYTVAKYPIEASDQNAIAAKQRAMADGQQMAFRSLLKRLTPVTARRQLDVFKDVKAGGLIGGVSVRSESSSSTDYVATFDFAFDPGAVRRLLQQRGIPFVDEQAPEIRIVPVFVAPSGTGTPTSLSAQAGAKTWTDIWRSLDLDHALAPATLAAAPATLNPAAIKTALQQPEEAVRLLGTALKTDTVLIAALEPDLSTRRLYVTLSGQDAVGLFTLRRAYRLDVADFAYTAELGAVVATGVLDGRWKQVKLSGGASGGGGVEAVQLTIEFRNLQEWQDMRRRIASLSGVSEFDVGGLSGRSASAALRFPGGGQAFADALVTQGLSAMPANGVWVVRSPY